MKQAADMPRILANNRLPATGGISPLPPTSVTEPKILDGDRPPYTGRGDGRYIGEAHTRSNPTSVLARLPARSLGLA